MTASAARVLETRARRRAWTIIDRVAPAVGTMRRSTELLRSGQLVIGRHSYGMPDVVVFPGESQRVLIGSFCSIADDVRIFVGGNHRPDWISTFPFRIAFGLPGQREDGCPTSKGDVTIGHDVWIGSGARVLSGVNIGNGAVIGASAVVAGDVAPYAIVIGNPAREVRKRFSEEHIAALEQLAWWDWPLDKIIDSVGILCSPDISSLLAGRPDARTIQ